jgi:hypothetical protein
MRIRKLTDAQVSEIQELAKTSIKKTEIARRYGISPQLVSTVIRYGYTSRPNYLRKVPAGQEFGSWEALAREYNAKYPEDQLTAARFKEVHDIAIKKLRRVIEARGWTLQDLV